MCITYIYIDMNLYMYLSVDMYHICIVIGYVFIYIYDIEMFQQGLAKSNLTSRDPKLRSDDVSAGSLLTLQGWQSGMVPPGLDTKGSLTWHAPTITAACALVIEDPCSHGLGLDVMRSLSLGQQHVALQLSCSDSRDVVGLTSAVSGRDRVQPRLVTRSNAYLPRWLPRRFQVPAYAALTPHPHKEFPYGNPKSSPVW